MIRFLKKSTFRYTKGHFWPLKIWGGKGGRTPCNPGPASYASKFSLQQNFRHDSDRFV